MTAPAFLADADLREVPLPPNTPFRLVGLALGQGPSSQLEVLVVQADGPPSLPRLRNLWKERNKGRAAPLLLVALFGDQAVLCGPTAAGDDPPVHAPVERGQAERLCREALEQPGRHAAHRYLRDTLPAVADSPMPGLRNEGLLATHELARGARLLPAWHDAGAKARPLLARREEALLKGLGFKIEPCDGQTSILRAGPSGKKLAIAVLLRPDESPDVEGERFAGLSPVSYALTKADSEGLPYVVVSQATKIRLYPARLNVGVGRRGRTETFVEIHPGHLRSDEAAYLWLLLSADALTEGGTLDQLLEESKRFAGELAVKLRERIYGYVVPQLAQGLANARKLKKPSAKDLAETYQMAMTVLFRLLFVAYAEDKDLLPYRFNGLYQKHSLKKMAQDLVAMYPHGLYAPDRSHKRPRLWAGGKPTSEDACGYETGESPFDTGDGRWKEVGQLFHAVKEGHREWGVPEYEGGLFSCDPAESPAGALLEDVTLPDTVMGLVLWHLLVIESREGWGPVDFRSLSVREFGTIYEGLLESELSVAEVDLITDKEGYYRPCQAGETPVVKKSRIYLHNRSGARKASGTYFTKEFAVDHLLDHALEPALKDHLGRLDGLDETDAAERFFDFRVADIAMGSGHFLVAAVDRIERAFSGYLAKRALPGVRDELSRLRKSAEKNLGELAEQLEIEDMQLLRRQIARRCIYGVDLNLTAVNLARLSIWIHTFVPGLPLSVLERNLAPGNSLVGIGRIAEIEEKAKEDDLPLFPIEAEKLVGAALEPLERLARIADATLAEVRQARKVMEEAKEAVKPAEALCDIIIACRMSAQKIPFDLENWETTKEELVGAPYHREAQDQMQGQNALHFPVAFPEVFLRDRSGFDVVVGNPPWQEATVEEHSFWARTVPGIRGLNQRQQERVKSELRAQRPDLVALYEEEVRAVAVTRNALITGPYPGMGTGDPDLYKAFCWRFWKLVPRDGGYLGVVLPRSALSGKGSTAFRSAIFQEAESVAVTMLVNYREWVFDDVHQQYAIGLVAIHRAPTGGTAVRLRGPYYNMEQYDVGISKPPSEFEGKEVSGWTDSASLPFLPTDQSLEVFSQLRRSPRLDRADERSWRVRAHRELDATNDKGLMDLSSAEKPRGHWPVYKGESFELWNPDTGVYYAWADPKVVLPVLADSRTRSAKLSRSAFAEFDSADLRNSQSLPCHFPRIAFRDGTNRLNERTVITVLVPGKVFIGNQAPYLLWPRGTAEDQAFLLGVLSSLPLDWYARRFVERHLNFFLFNPLPVPRPANTNPLSKRVVALAGRLAAPDDRFATWAEAFGVTCGALPEDQKQDHIHELDAVIAHLYGLEEKHLIHIFETFHEGWDYSERLQQTLKHYRKWKGSR